MPEPLLDPDVRGRSGNATPAIPSDAPVESALQGDPISMEAIVPEGRRARVRGGGWRHAFGGPVLAGRHAVYVGHHHGAVHEKRPPTS